MEDLVSLVPLYVRFTLVKEYSHGEITDLKDSSGKRKIRVYERVLQIGTIDEVIKKKKKLWGIEFCGRYKRATCNASQKWKRLWLGKFPRKNPDDQQVGFIHKHRVILISHRLATWRNMDGRPE
ncbi:hypothetical protein WN944_025090 [Citrus x changshan-huyou]|uniref:Uncharacterized protein n=1 Tax=Citrus x changshan-huyou TaxID=2935761 RepID=A0AAP0LQ30_9ROSI